MTETRYTAKQMIEVAELSPSFVTPYVAAMLRQAADIDLKLIDFRVWLDQRVPAVMFRGDGSGVNMHPFLEVAEEFDRRFGGKPLTETIATALREGLDAFATNGWFSRQTAEELESALTPVVEQLCRQWAEGPSEERLNEISTMLNDAGVSTAGLTLTQAVSDVLDRASEAERRLREIAKAIRRLEDTMCEEDWTAESVDAILEEMRALAILDTGAGQGEKKRLPVLPDRFGPDRPENEP